MKIMYHIALATFILGFSVALSAQKTAIFQDSNASYKQGMDFYEQGLYGPAEKEFLAILNAKHEELTPSTLLKKYATLYRALCAVRLNKPDGEQLILDFIRENDPSALATDAKLEIANHYYRAKEYEKALTYFKGIDAGRLDKKQAAEVRFKLAYSYFLRKNFKEARKGFNRLKNRKDKHYYAANYYYGVCNFFLDDYKKALASFKKVNSSKKYGKVVPYYIVQIHFARKEYKELLEFAEPYALAPDTKYHAEINQLIGLAHFELGDFEKALPSLENYVEGAGKITQEEIYQLAYAQYKTGNYTAAIQNFEELKEIDSEFGQNALYNLADSYLKTDRKNTARSAFLAASKMSYDELLQQEALFNYGKLCYELKQDREAINAFLKFPSDSKYYKEAQELMGLIFLDTRDYVKALEIMEAMPSKTAAMREAYQKVAFYRGIQLFNDGKLNDAAELFNKSLKNGFDSKVKALSYYWLGEIDYLKEDYEGSSDKFTQFQSLALLEGEKMPDNASVHTASYGLGYSYLKQERYAAASRHFEDCVQGIKREKASITDQYVTTQLLPDATLRAADCYFKLNSYKKAGEFYDEVIQSKYTGLDYAMYQKGTILGLQNTNNPIDKILLLEKLYTDYPHSLYADNALFSLGATYLRIGKLENAAKMYETLLNKYKDSDLTTASLLKLGLIYVNLGDNNKGLGYFKEVFDYNPDSQEAKDALNGIEEIYITMDDPQGYFSFLENIPGYEVSDLKKDSVLFKAGEAPYAEGNYEKATKAYSSYLKAFPRGTNSLDALFKRAESYFALKEYDLAFEDYEKVLQRGNSKFMETSARNAGLIAYNIKKDFVTAVEYFELYLSVASSEDNQHEASLGVLRSAYRSQNSGGVYGAGDRIIANPKSTKPEKAEAHYCIAKLAFEDKDYDKARSAFNKVIRLTEDERAAEARYMIAYIYYLERDLDIAEELCLNTNQQIIGYEYWLAKSVLLLADIFIEKGDTFNARASLESLVDNYTGDQAILESAKEKLNRLKESSATNSRIKPEPDKNADLEMEEDKGH